MTNSLRDALTTAADDPAPPSTVDIDAALSTGHRRRVRKLSAVAVTATCVLAATVSVGSAAVRAGPTVDPATPTQLPPSPCAIGSLKNTLPSADGKPQHLCVVPIEPAGFPCGNLDTNLVDAARAVLPSVGTWSAPRLAHGCDPQAIPNVGRDFMIEIADERGTGLLWAGVMVNPGVGFTRALCDAGGIPEAAVCKSLPEGNQRHWAQDNGDNRATMDTPNGAYIQVGWRRCVDDLIPAPCAATPAFTPEQLADLAFAISRKL